MMPGKRGLNEMRQAFPVVFSDKTLQQASFWINEDLRWPSRNAIGFPESIVMVIDYRMDNTIAPHCLANIVQYGFIGVLSRMHTNDD
jgi:hypothetical protein